MKKIKRRYKARVKTRKASPVARRPECITPSYGKYAADYIWRNQVRNYPALVRDPLWGRSIRITGEYKGGRG
jgi:hypothetical protein